MKEERIKVLEGSDECFHHWVFIDEYITSCDRVDEDKKLREYRVARFYCKFCRKIVIEKYKPIIKK